MHSEREVAGVHDTTAYRGQVGSASLISAALQHALQSWDGLLEWLPVGICTCDAEGLLVQYNRRAAELWGRVPAPGDPATRFCGAYKAYSLDGEPLAAVPMAELLTTGQPVRDRELVIERPDGSRRTILANLDPLLDEDGRLVGGVNCFQDITELKRQEEMRREGERRFRDLLEALPAAVYTTDAAGRLTFYNAAAAELWGRWPALGDEQWCGSWRLYWPDGRAMAHEECPMAVALKENRPVRGAEAMAERPDGSRVPFIPYPTPLRDAAGKLVGAVNMLVDITGRKHAEAQQKTLINELNHRVKNTLATVQSLAAQTLSAPGVPRHVRQTFEGRLLALSRVHNQLTRTHWESADLEKLLDDIFASYRSVGPERISLMGVPVRLAPQAALTLAMVLNELATNAAKYGSLSAPGGRLSVIWSVTGNGVGPVLRLDWQETGGPAVQPPVHRGFGSRLLKRAVTQALRGAAELSFEPAGVRCSMEIPLAGRAA
jgi:PAS domain S-box-containing protein